MEIKTFEIRDAGTFIPALAVKMRPMDERDRFLLSRAGYGLSPQSQEKYIMLVMLETERCAYAPHNWPGGARTMPVAHEYIEEHFDELENGAVVDVEFILGLSAEPKVSEDRGDGI